jgi:hypothetical protein
LTELHDTFEIKEKVMSFLMTDTTAVVLIVFAAICFVVARGGSIWGRIRWGDYEAEANAESRNVESVEEKDSRTRHDLNA